jgi:death on curing protein
VSREIRFLSVDDVLTLHAIAIKDQGGDLTLRDRALLESATATPAQQFGGQYLHEDIPAMAAAYAFHICSNHPFLDGNKRAAAAAMIAFLSDNGWSFEATPDEAEANILQLAAGTMDKPSFTAWSRNYMREKPKMELRDFFSRIDPVTFSERFLSLLPAHTGAKQEELLERVTEASVAIPLLDNLAKQQNEAKVSGETAHWERVTFLAVGILTLHAMAEDMGYEW